MQPCGASRKCAATPVKDVPGCTRFWRLRTQGTPRAEAFWAPGLLARDQGDFAAARSPYQASVVAWRSRGAPPRGYAEALNDLGDLAVGQSDFEMAAALYQEASPSAERPATCAGSLRL